MTRTKTGGRTKGTPNKKTKELRELIESYGHNPVEALVKVAMDEEVDISLKSKVNLELMQYIYPKRKAIDMNIEGSVQTVSATPLTADEWEKEYGQHKEH